MNKLSIYNNLEKGDRIQIKYDSCIRKGERYHSFTVNKGKTLVGKRKVERITLINTLNPKGVKYYLYNSNDKITLAVGDMAASIVDMLKNTSETENIINKTDDYILTQSIASGNFILYYDNEEYIHADYELANTQIKAIEKVRYTLNK